MNAVICIIYFTMFGLFAWGMCREDRQLRKAIRDSLHAEVEQLEADHHFELWEASL